jgi:hypothetical protein
VQKAKEEANDLDAYDHPQFGNLVAWIVWSTLRLYCPLLKPWHNPNLNDPYPADRNENKQAPEGPSLWCRRAFSCLHPLIR